MTRSLTPDEILAALRRFNITFHEQPGWRTRTNGSGWGDVVGFMWHHTGDDAPDNVDLRIVRDGRAGLSGPLSQFGLRDDGTVDLIAAGAANHAGGGDPLVLAAVSKESYTAYPPKPRYAHGQAGSISGNGRFYGVETYYLGTPDPRAAKTMPVLAAAIIDALDRVDVVNTWTARSAIGHKEWQRGKVDPSGVDCHTLRTQTNSQLARVKAGMPVTTTAPTTDTEDILMTLTVLNPATKTQAPIATALASIWAYEFLNFKMLVAQGKAAGIDVDESAIAAQVLAGLTGPLKDAVTAAVTAGGSVEQITDAVVTRFITAVQGA